MEQPREEDKGTKRDLVLYYRINTVKINWIWRIKHRAKYNEKNIKNSRK